MDEDVLNALPPKQLATLRNNGALGLAYCLLISMQHLPKLGELANAHARLAAQTQPNLANSELGLDFMSNDGTLSFGTP